MKIKKHINLQQVRAGQILATDVCDAQGNCLMAADVVLDTTMLNRLQERGVEILTVWQQQPLSEAEMAAHQTAIEVRLAFRFRQMQDDPNMRKLHDILLAYRMENIVDTSVDNGGDDGSI